MNNDSKILSKIVNKALAGEGAHVSTANVFEGFDWKMAGTRPTNAPHSIFELLMHISYWQDWGVQWLDGKRPAIPRHAAASWPKSQAPANEAEWKRAVRNFRSGLDDLQRRVDKTGLLEKIDGKTRLQMLHTLASHASYHAGEVVSLRQMLGSWPPPSGGLTW